MEIRRYEPGDLAEFARLFNDYRVFYEQPSDLGLAKRFIAERTQADDSVIFVADAGDSMLTGFCQLYPSLCSIAAAPIYVLYDLFVSPASRRAGVARQLLQAGASRAKSDGKVRMDLTTARDNLKAQALYESLGWIRDDVFYTYNLAVK
ncbi:GNAT family N-acetyltransferase [Paraburkholderia terricola]|uniref:Ribosomal protein S18 acetylase RimI-like enzyme n=1 Tax=Paraburkholderia terricola TaxID=169427 RepID=A0ABU1M2J8_9BURK|nr:GNAT family N-acetyltransferase [Paraburkholderia terricola]MDR6413259.1 ribosomal protein S18 acetylase RimI-like enzyme [Paraburkholderia terricola]MDR6485492.1 ribosomal protein S18 acetylase RimI-like enzyme [Paraburkholderia terricola]